MEPGTLGKLLEPVTVKPFFLVEGSLRPLSVRPYTPVTRPV